MDEIELRRFLESAAVDEPAPDEGMTTRMRRPTASPRRSERAPTPHFGDEKPDSGE